MKKNNKNRLHSGFTIAELLLSMFIVMVIAVAMVPIIGPKKIQIPAVAGTHGIYECYYDGEQLKQYYATGNNDPMPSDVDSCTFTPPNADNFQVFLIPGGPTGYSPTNGEVDYFFENFVDVENGNQTQQITTRLSMESFAGSLRKPSINFTENSWLNDQVVLISNGVQYAYDSDIIKNMLRNTFLEWAKRPDITSDGMYLEFYDLRSPIGRAGKGLSHWITYAGEVDDTSCENLESNPDRDLVQQLTLPRPSSGYWATDTQEKNSKINTTAESQLGSDFCRYLLHFHGSPSMRGAVMKNPVVPLLFPFTVDDIFEGDESSAAHNVLPDPGAACFSDSSNCHDLSIQAFRNQIQIESSSSGDDASEDGNASDSIDSPKIYDFGSRIHLFGNCDLECQLDDQKIFVENPSRSLTKDNVANVFDSGGYNAGLIRGNLAEEGLTPDDDLVHQAFFENVSDWVGFTRLGGELDQGLIRYYEFPYQWQMTQPMIRIAYGSPGSVTIDSLNLTSQQMQGEISFNLAQGSGQATTMTVGDNRYTATAQNGTLVNIVNSNTIERYTNEGSISTLFNRIKQFVTANNSSIQAYINVLAAARLDGYTHGIIEFCNNDDDDMSRCPGLATNGSYPLVDYIEATVTTTITNLQNRGGSQGLNSGFISNNSVINRTDDCDDGFTQDETEVVKHHDAALNDDINLRFCKAAQNNNHNTRGAVIIRW